MEIVDQLTTKSRTTFAVPPYSIKEESGKASVLITEEWWMAHSAQYPHAAEAFVTADACLQGRSRRVEFYRQEGKRQKLVAFFDAEAGGLKLLE